MQGHNPDRTHEPECIMQDTSARQLHTTVLYIPLIPAYHCRSSCKLEKEQVEVRSSKSKAQSSVERGVWNMECGVWNAERCDMCGACCVECGVRDVECSESSVEWDRVRTVVL